MNGDEWKSLQVNIRDFFERIIDERDARYNERFIAADKAVNAALAAQQTLTGAAFASSEKAITKAEEAQREYNVRSNEFRGQLDDQAKLLMPRNEALGLIASLDEKIVSLREDRDRSAGRAGLSAPLIEKLITFALALVGGYLLAQLR